MEIITADTGEAFTLPESEYPLPEQLLEDDESAMLEDQPLTDQVDDGFNEEFR